MFDWMGKVAWWLGDRGRRALAMVLGRVLWWLMPSRRRLTVANLQAAFPEASQKSLHQLARAAYRNLALVGLELLATPHMPMRALRQRFRFTNPELVHSALAQGRGVILASAHLANWEWSALAAALEFRQPLLVVVKEQRNRAFNQWLWRVRTLTGNRLVPMYGAARAMLQQLGSGGIVALLADQAAEPGSDVFVPFFGRPALTHKAPAALARRTGALLVVAYCLRAADGNYDVFFEPIAEANDEAVPLHHVVALYTQRLEAAIRRAPEQWVWQHNRWKYTPPQQQT